MTGPIVLLATAVAFAAPPDHGESGFTVETVPVQFDVDPSAASVALPSAALVTAEAVPPSFAEAAVAAGIRTRRTAVRTPRRPLRAVLNGQRLARPPGALPDATDEVSEGPGRSDGIPPSGPAGLRF